MTAAEYEKAKDKWLDDAETRIGRALSGFERDLLDRIIDVISQNLRSENGRITGFDTAIYNRIADVFSRFDNRELQDIIRIVAQNIVKAIDLNQAYLSKMEAANFQAVSDSAKRDALRSIGIIANGTSLTNVSILPGSPLAVLLSSSNVRTRIVRVVMNAVNGGLSLTQTLSSVREVLQSSKNVESTFLKYYKTNVFDVLVRTDRLHNTKLADGIGLTAFVYAGTVIEKTRSFCKSKAGKVFLVSEAEEWKKQDWAGKNEGYNPLRDLGGYNCRHQVRYISNTEALRRRDDLKVVNGKLKVM